MVIEDLQRERAVALDSLLFEICETLQLTPTQHQKAVDRYKSITRILDSPNTPFSHINSNLYPQGSMRLRTTVKPMDGPHDLDFVCEFDVSHTVTDPMVLLGDMYSVFKQHGVYGGMVELKKRCVRIVYQDEFYLDIVPACRDHGNGGSCIQIPDQDLKWWSPSNPLAYAIWFENATRRILVHRFSERLVAMDKAASIQPIPNLEATEDKTVLQLVVQMLKRWRDMHYANSSFPPISIVLTTLAADLYEGEVLLSQALLAILDRIVSKIDLAHTAGHRLEVRNPVHDQEDLSERWDGNPNAYLEFVDGIRTFANQWRYVCTQTGNPNQTLEELFGEVANLAIIKQTRDLQVVRNSGGLGIRSSGLIVPVAAAISPMLRNTNHGGL